MPVLTLDIDGFTVELDTGWPAKLVRALLRRHYERMERRLLRRAVAPGDRVIELGTSLGIVAMGIARRTGAQALLCFEANPQVLPAARRNFALNDIAPAVHNRLLVSRASAARADGAGAAAFFTTPYFLSSSTLPHRNDMTAISVETAILEDAIARHRANVLVADIEGGEIGLFGDADLAGIDRLLVELHYDRTSVEACMALIDGLARQGLALDAGAVEGDVYLFIAGGARPSSDELAGVRAYMQGAVALKAGAGGQALAYFRQAAGAAPGTAWFHLALAGQLAASGEPKLALASCTRACDLAPGNEDCHEQQGLVLLSLQSFADAELAFRRALDLAGDRPLFHAGLGRALAGQGRIGEARNALETALAMDPVEVNPKDMFIKDALEHLG